MKSSAKIKDYFTNFVLVVLSIFFTLFIAEGLSRIIVDPVDYLMPYLINDDILGHRIMANSGGHDSWGYRNKSVPISADIVAIGDSQTYGVSATANNSWPAVLQQMTGRKVYNLSLGGYGPVEYRYLLESEALKLNPSLVIVGFYYGNDIRDAYTTAYTNDYWEHLRKPGFIADGNLNCPDFRLQMVTTNYGFFRDIKSFRDWLAHHSVVYRIVTDSPIGDRVRLWETKYDYAGEDITVFEDQEHNIQAGFTPPCRFDALNLKDPRIQEGLRISLELFNQMKEISQDKGTNFLVVLIPTKETVFAPFIENNKTLHNSQIIDKLIMNERQNNDLVKAYFEEHHIAYIDVLGALSNAVGKEEIYPTSHDSHPNKNGYKIIARTIQQYLAAHHYLVENTQN